MKHLIMKIIIVGLSLFATALCNAQNKIPTEQEARAFFANANDTLITTMTVFEEDGPLYDLYSRKNPGDIVITGTEICQVVGQQIQTIYNCSAVSFDKEKQGYREVEKLQKTIMAKYNFGTSFEELTAIYVTPERIHEMDIRYEDMPDCPLKTAIDGHKPSEIFIVDISETYSYAMIINSPPLKKKSITIKQAIYQ